MRDPMKLLFGSFLSFLIGVVALGGCVSIAPESPDMAQIDEMVVQAPLDETWQFTKSVLREKEYILYTRDKRGSFVAWSNPKRRRLRPHRFHFTITLDRLTASSTRVTVETIHQQYGVTLLTYPGWHNLKTANTPEAMSILEAVSAKASGGAEEGSSEASGGANG